MMYINILFEIQQIIETQYGIYICNEIWNKIYFECIKRPTANIILNEKYRLLNDINKLSNNEDIIKYHRNIGVKNFMLNIPDNMEVLKNAYTTFLNHQNKYYSPNEYEYRIDINIEGFHVNFIYDMYERLNNAVPYIEVLQRQNDLLINDFNPNGFFTEPFEIDNTRLWMIKEHLEEIECLE